MTYYIGIWSPFIKLAVLVDELLEWVWDELKANMMWGWEAERTGSESYPIMVLLFQVALTGRQLFFSGKGVHYMAENKRKKEKITAEHIRLGVLWVMNLIL